MGDRRVLYRAPVLLEPSHSIDDFECASAEQTEWLRLHSRQSIATGSTRVLVVTEIDSHAVAAYYAWCMSSVHGAEVPARAKRGAGRYPEPMALLARLGVDVRHEGCGLGAALLKDVISRTLLIGDEIGCRDLLVHAETTLAKEFYLHLIPQFEESPTDPLHLLLLMKDIHRSLSR